MSLVFSDGCDSYGSTADILKKWAAAASPWAYNATAGRNGGGALQIVNSTSVLSTPLAIFAATELCAAFWIKVSTTPAAATTFFVPKSSVGTRGGGFRINTSGIILGVDNLDGTLTTGLTNICDNAWHWVEFDLKNAGAASTLKCYVDTILQFTTTTGSSNTLTADRIDLNGLATATMTIDDIVFWDNNGAAPLFAAYPLGPRQITTKRPNGDSTVAFTRLSGASNYLMVNEQAWDGDTTYNEDGTSGDQDLYDFDNFSTNPAGITAVMWNSVLKNPNAGTINYQAACKSNLTTTLGTSTITPSAYTTKQVAYAVDPNTAAAWGATALDAAQFGIKVV